MTGLPPVWVRRVLIAPMVLALALWALLALPLGAIAALFASRYVPGRWRPLRVLWFTVVYLTLETLALIAAFALWVWSGFGAKLREDRFLDRHYRLLGWFLARLIASAERTFNVVVEAETSGPRGHDAPRIVLARHAGPGDSFLLVHEVCSLGRRPRIVLKDSFRWEPLFDTILSRLPCRFVSPTPKPGRVTGQAGEVAELASGMGDRDSLVIFPEGGNITEQRRLRSIAKLEERGLHEQAEQARAMRHVMAPRPGGALAAITACPEADVVFVAHTGLEDLSSPIDLWRGLPMDTAVKARSWYVPRSDVPVDRDEQAQWLFDWWQRIDEWIAATRGVPGDGDVRSYVR